MAYHHREGGDRRDRPITKLHACLFNVGEAFQPSVA